MDLRIDGVLIDMEAHAFQAFRDFMTRVAKMDELRNAGYQLLVEFQRELGFFGRPPLEKESSVIQSIIKDNQTFGLKKYIEAGFRHSYMDAQNICKLNLIEQSFRDHLPKVKSLLNEIENLVEDVLSKMQVLNRSSIHILDRYLAPDNQGTCSDEEIGVMLTHGDKILLPSILMRVLYNMLKCDYEMQEHIVSALGLSSSSEELESYCLMWELRPFVNEDIMKHSWELIPESVAPK